MKHDYVYISNILSYLIKLWMYTTGSQTVEHGPLEGHGRTFGGSVVGSRLAPTGAGRECHQARLCPQLHPGPSCCSTCGPSGSSDCSPQPQLWLPAPDSNHGSQGSADRFHDGWRGGATENIWGPLMYTLRL